MYKPEPKSIEQLKSEKKEVMQKIINGSHLDYYSMDKLQRHLAELNKQIKEIEGQIKSHTQEAL